MLRYACVVMSRNLDPLYTLVVATQSSGRACFYTNICIRHCICVCVRDNHTTMLSCVKITLTFRFMSQNPLLLPIMVAHILWMTAKKFSSAVLAVISLKRFVSSVKHWRKCCSTSRAIWMAWQWRKTSWTICATLITWLRKQFSPGRRISWEVWGKTGQERTF